METHERKKTSKKGEEVQMMKGDLIKVGIPQIEEEDLPEKMGIQMGGDGGSDPNDSGDGDDSSSSSDSTQPRRRRHRRPKYVYVLQGPPGPPDQEGKPGQPGQAGRDGRDGQAPPLTRALEEALRAQRTNLDTTGLENSFSQFGRTMYEVLKAQQRTNQNLEEQLKDMAQANFDHWLYQIESLCEMSLRDI